MKELAFSFNKWVLIFSFLGYLTAFSQKKWKYPESIRIRQEDVYHGFKVEDPYRWLEDENDQRTMDWIRRQNEFTENFFKQEIPFRDKIEKELETLFNYSVMSMPVLRGDVYVTQVIFPEKNQPVLYFSEKYIPGWKPGWKELLDINKKSEKGLYSLTGLALQKEKKILAYSLSYSGSDWNTIYFKNISNGKHFTDSIPYIQFSSLSWWKDNLIYTQAEKPDEKRMYSRPVHSYSLMARNILNGKDSVLYAIRDSQRVFLNGYVTEDQRFLIVSISKGTSGNMLKIKKLNHPQQPWLELGKDMKRDYSVQDNLGDTLFILTNDDAPDGKVIAYNFKTDQPMPLKDVWKMQSGKVVKQFVASPKGFVIHYLQDVVSQCAYLKPGDSVWMPFPMQDPGTISSVYFDKKQKKFFVSRQSFFLPLQVLEMDITNKTWKQVYSVNASFRAGEFESRQVFFPARDGTKIPMFVLSKKNRKPGQPVPAFVYGYGGFNIALTPSFSAERLLFLKRGGIYVIVNLRGGGEYGEKWHEAGTKCNKQNVFNDFMDAIDYMVKMQWTSYDKVAIHGRSNGGLLIGAVITQRPDICRVAVPSVGVLDMLRYQHFTVGRAWASDYGLSENPDEFQCLIKYSPYHNTLRGQRNPAVLITTADHDDRVVPAHSFKFAAAMQYHSISEFPVLIRIEKSAGHGAGKPRKQIFQDASYMWGFVFKYLNVEY